MLVLCITLNPAIDMTMAVDDFEIGKVNRAKKTQIDAAGKGLNAAQILSDLGFDVTASGFLAKDNAFIFDRLFASRHALQGGQFLDAFLRVSGSNRTNIKLTDKGLTTDINGEGFFINTADKTALFDRLGNLAKNSQAVLVAGSLPQGFGADDFDRLLGLLTSVCDKVAVDVSGQALKVALKHKLWLIKPNDDELSEVFGKSAKTIQEQHALITDLSIEHVVVSMGARGVNWFFDGKTYQAIPPKITVVSTVGAGDTLVAGMMAGLLLGENQADILARAVALSAHAVSIVGFCAADDDRLNELLPQVKICQITNLSQS